MFWGSKGLFLAAYLLFWCLVKSLLSLQLVSCSLHFWDSFCFVFVFFVFWVLLLLSSFVEVFFCFCLSSSSWVGVTSLLCGRAGFLPLCLGVGFGAVILWWTLGGVCGQGQPGGVNIFFAVCHNRRVWAKTRTSPQGEDFFERFWLRNRAWKEQKKWSVFNFGARNAIKIGVSGSFLKTKSAPTLFTKRTFAVILLWGENILVVGLGGAKNTHKIVTKRCKNRGFRDFEVSRIGREKRGNWSVQEWPVCTLSIMGCLCCAT